MPTPSSWAWHPTGRAGPPRTPGSADVDAAGERRVEGEETLQGGVVGAAELLHVRAAAGAGPGDDLGLAVAVHVAGRHAHAAGEVGAVGEEVGERLAVGAVEDLDLREAPRPGADHQVILAVAVDVTGRHEHATAEGRREGEE